jgi:hypothetical protein
MKKNIFPDSLSLVNGPLKTSVANLMKMLLWAGGVAQVIEHLPSEHETLSSNSSTTHTEILDVAVFKLPTHRT